MNRISTTMLALMLITGLLILSGCGGGAKQETTVTIKSAVGDAEESGGGTEVKVEGFGSLKGKVIFEGTLPAYPDIVKQGSNIKDAAVCSAENIPDERLVIGEGNGVANVFIYLGRKPKGVEIPAAPTEPVVFDQKGCKFIPHALTVRTGQPVNILSDDSIAHNTHTLPKNNAVFNTVIKANERDGVPLVYNSSEPTPVRVICDFHTWMVAYHMPLDHPYMALTDKDGNFEIKDLPAGKHEFKVWHEAAGGGGYVERKLEVTIEKDKETPLNITYAADKIALKGDNGARTIKISSLSK